MLDPELSGEELAALATERPDLWDEICAHPNAYEGLIEWIENQPQPNLAQSASRLGQTILVFLALVGLLVVALTAGGASWYFLKKDDGTVAIAKDVDREVNLDVSEEVEAVPTMVILDASGSMRAKDAPGMRFDAAKRAVEALVGVLPDEQKIGLIVYGAHESNDPKNAERGCQDIEQAIEYDVINRSEFLKTVDGYKPSGYTPIAESLNAAAAALPQSGKRNIVLISDGIDSCFEREIAPDPCEVAQELAAANDELTIHTIGFKVADEPSAALQLECIANTTSGTALVAGNDKQLQSRLKVVFRQDLVARSVQPTGYHGIDLGMSVEQAQELSDTFKGVSETGRVEIVYIDCTVVFQDGEVVEVITKTENAPTIDGIKVGDDISQAEAMYGTAGTPVLTEDNAVIFPADVARGTGYRFEYTPGTGEKLNGAITRIVLCRCLPAGKTKVILLNPLTTDGRLLPAYTLDTSNRDGLSSFFGEDIVPWPSSYGTTERTYSVGANALGADACWPYTINSISVICADGPWENTLRLFEVDYIPESMSAYHGYDDDSEPSPYGIELADGSRWQSRHGGSWDGRPDNLTGAYFCIEKCEKENWYILQAKAENDGWYAYMGALGNVPEASEKPVRTFAKEVRFIR